MVGLKKELLRLKIKPSSWALGLKMPIENIPDVCPTLKHKPRMVYGKKITSRFSNKIKMDNKVLSNEISSDKRDHLMIVLVALRRGHITEDQARVLVAKI